MRDVIRREKKYWEISMDGTPFEVLIIVYAKTSSHYIYIFAIVID